MILLITGKPFWSGKFYIIDNRVLHCHDIISTVRSYFLCIWRYLALKILALIFISHHLFSMRLPERPPHFPQHQALFFSCRVHESHLEMFPCPSTVINHFIIHSFGLVNDSLVISGSHLAVQHALEWTHASLFFILHCDTTGCLHLTWNTGTGLRFTQGLKDMHT